MAMQMLRTGGLAPQEQVDAWNLIDRQLDQLLSGVEDVSELLRVDAGSFRLREELGDLRDMFDLLEGRGEIGRGLARQGMALLVDSWPTPLIAMHDPGRLAMVLEFLVMGMSRMSPKDSAMQLCLRSDGSVAVWTVRCDAGLAPLDPEVSVVIGESSNLDAVDGRAMLVREIARMQGIAFEFFSPGSGLSFSMPLEK